MFPTSLPRAVAVLAVVLALTPACGRQNADDHLRKGDALLAESKLQDAILEYRTAVQADPKRGDIRIKLADAYMQIPDAAAALREFVRAADLLSNDATAQIRAGNILIVAGRMEDAKSRAKRALAIDPRSAEAQILYGNALAGLKDMDGAMTEYQQALALDPTQDAAFINIATMQYVGGHHPEAEANFKKAVQAAPKSVRARLGLANFYWVEGRRPEAEQALKDALALAPNDVAINRALGMFYIANKRPLESEPYFRTIAKQSNTTATSLSLADYYLTTKRTDEARKVLETLAADESTYAAATTRLAAIDATNGNRPAALAKVNAVLDKHPKESAARLLLARLLLADGKRDEALAQANKVVAEEPRSLTAANGYLLIGRIQAAIGHREQAIAAYEQVLARQPQPMEAALALGSLHLDAGAVAKAATYAHQARVIQPSNVAARELTVRVLVSQKEPAKATEELASLRKELPKDPVVIELTGSVQLLEREMDAARASYAKAATLAPGDLKAVTGLVQVDLASGRTKEALAQLDTTLKSAKPSGTFLVFAAGTYAKAGNLAKTEELLKQAIEVDPTGLQAYNFLGQLYLAQHRLDVAEEQFQRMVKQNPKSVSANTMLGLVLDLRKRPAEAEKQYLAALSLDPQAGLAANNLAWLYVSGIRNLDRALELAKIAQQGAPDNPNFNDTLGWIYYRKLMTAEAVKFLEASVAKDGSDPSSNYHLGMAYIQAGQTDKARASLQKALSLRSDFDDAEDARKALNAIGGT